MRSSTLRALMGAVLTVGLMTAGATSALAHETYEVKAGDTLAKIAAAHGFGSWQDLHAINLDTVTNPNLIYVGQVLTIAGDAPKAAATSKPKAETKKADSTKSSTKKSSNADSAKSAPKKSSNDSAKAAPKKSSNDSAKSAPKKTSTKSSAPAPKGTVSGSVWDRLAQCESGGNWQINTGNGYYGGLQFSKSSWNAVGGSGYPHEASKSEQIARAEKLLDIQGWGAWPACSRKLGLR